MTLSSDLRAKAQEFTDDLNQLIEAVIGVGGAFQIFRQIGEDLLLIAVSEYPSRDIPGLPLKRRIDASPHLFLRVSFKVMLDSQKEFLQVNNSIFGLWVKTPRRENPRPFVRVEYDRNKKRASPAHIQIHAKSEDLEWIDESAGVPNPRPLQKIHFPAGGRRFRATLEDFLFFLDRDKIFTDWKPGWEGALVESRKKWQTIQVRATVRRYPELIVQALEGIGYKVTPPAPDRGGM